MLPQTKGLLAILGVAAAILAAQACTPTWQPHPETESWPLLGKHVGVACAECHPAGIAAEVPLTCEGCHEADRPAQHDPGPCKVCHTEEGWDRAHINHDFFPLTHAHDLACDSCHTNGTYQGLDPACSSCHEQDRPNGHFDGSDCASCHTPTSWDDATFNHNDYFRVPHEGVSDCGSCHLAAPDYSTFSCIDCHEHSRGSVDPEHNGVNGYSYTSEACLRCHG